MTPVMQQYHRIKKANKGSVLFFRMGDFYEMFEDDAKEVSSILNLTLTKRHGIPMCGIPYHASRSYIGRLLKAGKKIAVCEQISLPENGRGIAERAVVEVITPGTVMDEDYLDKNRNNYLVSLGLSKKHLSISYIDLSTAEFYVSSWTVSQAVNVLKKELLRLSPKEIIVQESMLEIDDYGKVINDLNDVVINRYPDWSFDQKTSAVLLKKQLSVSNLKGFGLDDDHPALYSCGILLEYIEDTAKSVLPHIQNVEVYSESKFLGLDESSLKNLEILTNLQTGTGKYTLMEVMDNTRTSMGTRKLRSRLLHPLRDPEVIENRLDKVEYLYRNQIHLNVITEVLKGFMDLERLASKVAMDKAHAKDLISVKNTLMGIRFLEDEMKNWSALDILWPNEPERSKAITDIELLLESGIADEPSILLTEGNLIKEGYNSELDELRRLKDNSQAVLTEYLESEREASGIQNLKIRYNKIIGYFLEITKSNLDLVPENYIRRQSLVGSERFTTDRLIELESDLNSARENSVELEKSLFLAVRDQLKKDVPNLLSVSEDVAILDCYASMATAATRNGWVRPKLNNSKGISIINGRHPVVEAHIPQGDFVPNTLITNADSNAFTMITGPNMAGKSTFLRQNALIVLMAQIGSFVPADEAVIGSVDRIFCRVGASDNLARGESTFLVEMNETAYILRTATDRSLVIMDEVGRGTSTNDGLSIAWAVSEYLIEKIKAKTLFATHYHELTTLESKHIQNLSLEVLEREGDIIFLKKIRTGAAGNSYGIHVAGLAGLPDAVVKRARILIHRMEEIELKNGTGQSMFNKDSQTSNGKSREQESLFSYAELLEKEILSLSLDETTPFDALKALYRWQKELKNN
ncbi:MAG: DNA mismatch repair protein MutS [Spirochaetales bacterium]|nr:DNA mismatch repair protein MutS [Spirochaetales bacterium]